MGTSRRKVLSGLFWSYGERLTAQGISLIVSIILSRILCPEEYGIIAIVLIFISICDAFLIGGLGNSLIQKKDSDDLDASSIFYCSMSISIVLYIILFFTAPLISRFYDNEVLIPLIRVLALRLPISGYNTIQQSIIQKKMAFKKFFYATISGTFISGIIGILMAIRGFGVWALVGQYLSKTIIDTLVLFVQNRWVPKLKFSLIRTKVLVKFGWKLLVSNLIYTFEGNCRGLFVDKVFGPSDLAFYDQGNKFPNLIVANINSTISKVLFPALSHEQDNISILKKMCRRSVKIGLFILTPLMTGLIIISKDFVRVILTDKWLPCVEFLQILSLVYFFKPLATMCQQAILALGKSQISLKIELIQSIFSIGLLCISVFMFKNLIAVAWSNVIVEILGIILLTYHIHSLIGYTYKEQLSDVLPIVLNSLIMGIIVYIIHFFHISPLYTLITQIIVGIISYIFISFITKSDSLIYIVNTLKSVRK